MNANELDALGRGDKLAWDGFVERYYPVIYAAVAKTLSAAAGEIAEEDVRDVCQNVFVRLCANDFRRVRSFDPARASLVTWLTIIARGVSIDFLRRRRLPLVAMAEDVAGLAADGPRAASGPELEIPAGLLTAQQTLVLQLLFDRDLAVAEAAKILGVTEQTVRSTKHKALMALRGHFAKHPPE
jgi:DNA-directed RNA polymerase specialized sigma24 family protein